MINTDIIAPLTGGVWYVAHLLHTIFSLHRKRHSPSQVLNEMAEYGADEAYDAMTAASAKGTWRAGVDWSDDTDTTPDPTDVQPPPHWISEEEYRMGEPGFDKLIYNFFIGDQVLTDDGGFPIPRQYWDIYLPPSLQTALINLSPDAAELPGPVAIVRIPRLSIDVCVETVEGSYQIENETEAEPEVQDEDVVSD